MNNTIINLWKISSSWRPYKFIIAPFFKNIKRIFQISENCFQFALKSFYTRHACRDYRTPLTWKWNRVQWRWNKLLLSFCRLKKTPLLHGDEVRENPIYNAYPHQFVEVNKFRINQVLKLHKKIPPRVAVERYFSVFSKKEAILYITKGLQDACPDYGEDYYIVYIIPPFRHVVYTWKVIRYLSEMHQQMKEKIRNKGGVCNLFVI